MFCGIGLGGIFAAGIFHGSGLGLVFCLLALFCSNSSFRIDNIYSIAHTIL